MTKAVSLVLLVSLISLMGSVWSKMHKIKPNSSKKMVEKTDNTLGVDRISALPLLDDHNSNEEEIEESIDENNQGVSDSKKMEVLDTGNDEISDKVSETEPMLPSSNDITTETSAAPHTSQSSSFFIFRWTGLLFFIGALTLIAGIFALIMLSIYYRLYLYKKKSVPFEAPRFLKMFFPAPMNYEHEITVLCSKYMSS